MKQFENLKVGDIVWTIQTGYAKVTSISDTKNYPILVDGWASYTLDGKWGCRDKYDSLYLENPFKESFESRWMMVSDGDEWRKRLVIAKYNGRFVAEDVLKLKDRSHFTSWKYARETPAKRTLTLQEIADKFEENIDNIEIL